MCGFYPLRIPVEIARALLLDDVVTLNKLGERPRFYHALVDNCTTGIRVHVKHIAVARPWDWRLLANGHSDELLYERGFIDTSQPFAEPKGASQIVTRAKAADQAPDFSERIRKGLLPRSIP